MIKINLLPVRAAKKKETAIQQFIIAGFAVAVIAVIVASMYAFKSIQVSSTKDAITKANNEINKLKTTIGKLEELKNLKDQVKKKLDVLALLRKKKTGPAQRLVSLSDLTPDQLWLTNYVESGPDGQDVKISGVAASEELIAQYMRALDASNDFTAVELVLSEQTLVGETKYKKFDISMKLKIAVQPPPATPAAK